MCECILYPSHKLGVYYYMVLLLYMRSIILLFKFLYDNIIICYASVIKIEHFDLDPNCDLTCGGVACTPCIYRIIRFVNKRVPEVTH